MGRKREEKKEVKMTARQQRATKRKSDKKAEAIGIIGLDNLKDIEPKMKKLSSKDGRIKRSKDQIEVLVAEFELRDGKCPPKKRREEMAKVLEMSEH